MLFYNLDNIPTNINYPDIYFNPEYGKACEYSDNAIWELCQYKDLIYVYLKKEYIFEEGIYYDLITPYGYSGYYYENQETYNEFIPLFREEAKHKNYLTEVVRQNPYLDINILEHYGIITSKKIYSFNYNVELNTEKINEYRKICNRATTNNISFKIEPYTYNTLLYDKFLDLYNSSLDMLKSTEYYYFNDNYYQELDKCQCMLANIYIRKKEKHEPFYKSENQILIIPLNTECLSYSNQIEQELNNFKVNVDSSEKTLSKRIMLGHKKYNYIIIIGDKEIENNTVSIKSTDDNISIDKDNLINFFTEKEKQSEENDNPMLINSCIIFEYNKFIHCHLIGCKEEYKHMSCNDFLYHKVNEYAKSKEKVSILGCGLKENDKLAKFKKKMSNDDFNYIIYNNVLNQEIYNKINKNSNNTYFPCHRN